MAWLFWVDFCSLDCLEKAKEKLKLAEVTSDVQTEARPKHKPNRYITSSEDEDNNDSHRHPPPLKKQYIDGKIFKISRLLCEHVITRFLFSLSCRYC